MASVDLATLTRRAKNPRRRVITLRPITPPALQATALYTSVYAPVIAIWSASLESITAAYAQSLSELQTDAPADVTARIEAASSSVSGVIVSLRFAIGRWSESVEAWHRRRWIGNVLTATNVSLETLIGASDVRATLATVIERNVALVSSVSDETRRRIADAAFRGLTERKPAAEFAKEIRGFVDMSRRRAKNIAADQLVKLGSELNQERRRQAGIDSVEWVSSGKINYRPEHKARNGNLYSENADRIGQKYQGKIIKKPPPADDRAGVPINCACTERAVLILD
ncbi:phage Mu protein F like protein [Blastomonas natatoria]|uniref:Phage Mu protein F like protein n=1 Tax=Blastomonas natatoria TaxID=34015 RepID=A0A2V3V398_9SPHN|nr:phage minor head protein [Blastomonas natatoria]PXW75970.1 phage Mu protein F like protein [Blastomonas natatoria]